MCYLILKISLHTKFGKCDFQTTHDTARADMIVPPNANAMIAPKFLKNDFCKQKTYKIFMFIQLKQLRFQN